MYCSTILHEILKSENLQIYTGTMGSTYFLYPISEIKDILITIKSYEIRHNFHYRVKAYFPIDNIFCIWHRNPLVINKTGFAKFLLIVNFSPEKVSFYF